MQSEHKMKMKLPPNTKGVSYAKPEDYSFIKKHLEQMNRETPTITSSTYSATAYNPSFDTFTGAPAHIPFGPRRIQMGGVGGQGILSPEEILDQHLVGITGENKMSAVRVVRVFIIDTNESLSLENRILVKGQEKITDLTDQELFFELPIAEILAKHNELRAKTKDKAQAKLGKDAFLEPARIRDLKMTVLNVAQF